MDKVNEAPWILLRGLSRESLHWQDWAAHLAESLQRKVVALDLPGAGIYHLQPSPLQIAHYTDHLRRIWQNDIDQGGELPVVLGLSMGGMVALDWAQRFGSELSAVVCINSSLANLAWPWQRLSPRLWPLVMRSLFASDVREREALILRMVSNKVLQQKRWNDWVDIQSQHPVTRGAVLRQLIAAARFRPRLSPLEIPSLFISSQQDRMVDPLISARMAAAFGGEFVSIAHAGHDIPIDAPFDLMRALLHWDRSRNQ